MDREHGERILRAIRRIMRRVAADSHEVARDTGLTVPQLLCLRAIHECSEPEVTVARVADLVRLSPSTTSAILQRLLHAGLIERQRSTRDRRRVCLSLSASGRERLRAVGQPLQQRFTTRLDALSVREQRALVDSLETLVELLEAVDVEAAPVLSVPR